MKYKYPVYTPSLLGNEKKYVNECLDSTWISSKGEFISRFESSFSDYLGIKHATSVCNGTVALHLALLALGIGPEDEVIVPTFTYIASVNAIVYTGAKPIFVDVIKDTWQMDPNDVERKISNKTKAIMAVHLYGYSCEMDSLSEIAKKNNIFLIEDCAEAIGSKFKKQMVGTFGDISCFSFFGNKTITTGEGGMVVTNDKTLFERCLHYKGQGLAKYREYWHDIIGYNYRMTNICAAIGLAQLERIDNIISKKRDIANWYINELSNLPLTILKENNNDIFHSYWMNCILVENNLVRDELREFLAKKSIETRPTFYPIHTMPMYSNKYQKLMNSEDLGWRGINLPSYPDLKMEDVTYITDSIKEFFKYNN